jgi:hypothetical protein
MKCNPLLEGSPDALNTAGWSVYIFSRVSITLKQKEKDVRKLQPASS